MTRNATTATHAAVERRAQDAALTTALATVRRQGAQLAHARAILDYTEREANSCDKAIGVVSTEWLLSQVANLRRILAPTDPTGGNDHV
jgi:hypothetical protein